MSKEKLTVGKVDTKIIFHSVCDDNYAVSHAGIDIINLIKQIREEITDKWNKDRQKTFEEIRDEVFDKYIK